MLLRRDILLSRKTNVCVLEGYFVRVVVIAKKCSFFLIRRSSKGLNAAVVKVL